MAKIAFSANSSWYIYNYRMSTVRALLALGHELLVMAPRDAYSNRLVEAGCKFVEVKVNRKQISIANDLLTFGRLLIVFIKKRPEIVLNFTPKMNAYATLAARTVGCCSVNNVSGLGGVRRLKGVKKVALIALYRISQRLASHIFFQNNEDRRFFEGHKIATNVSSERVVGSGVDLARFKPQPRSGNRLRFAFVGRFLSEKGVLTYLDAARQLSQKYGRQTEFWLLGQIDSLNPTSITSSQLSEYVEDGSVIVMPFTDKIEDFLSEIDCVVLPSSYGEGVPRSLLEAAAMGKVIITTDHPGCRDAIEDGVTGILCEPRSIESVIQAMENVYSFSDEQLKKMQIAAREKAQSEFCETIVVKRYVDVIEKLLR